MSFPVIDPTKAKADALWDQIQVLESILKGAAPGYVTKQWRKEDLDAAKAAFKDADKKADSKRDENGACATTRVEKTTYCLANYRDLRYALFGRVAMRTAGMNEKLSLLHRRAASFDQLEDLEKKK